MARIAFNVTTKSLLSLLVGLCVVALAAIPLFVPPDHLGWLRWKIATVASTVMAILSLLCQFLLQSKEDDLQSARELERDNKIHAIHLALDVLTHSHALPAVKESNMVQTKRGPDAIFDSELQRYVMHERTGLVPYKMLHEIYTVSGRQDEPKIDCDILVKMYLVNLSASVQYIREISASVEVDGKRTTLERRNDFKLKVGDSRDSPFLEFGFGPESAVNTVDPLKPLLVDALPCELPPNKPLEGWVRYILRDVVPTKIDSNTFEFAIVDSKNNRHFITKVSPDPKHGEIAIRDIR